MKILKMPFTLLGLLTLLTGCFTPEKYKNKKKILNSMTASIKKKHPKVENIEPTELKKIALKEDILLVDVRDNEEIAISKIKGSISVEEFNQNIEKYRNRTIISYCTVGMRSSDFTEKLLENGIRALNLEGGVLSWSHAGLTYQKDGIETKKVHVYSEAWNFLADGYEGVW